MPAIRIGDGTADPKRVNNHVMRLIRRDPAPTGSLEESECYDRSYGDIALGHVDVLHLEPSEPIEIPFELDDGHHVTSEGLKRQFAERLAARRRRR
jgi:hypothetical protein